jgi:hypothetical protein
METQILLTINELGVEKVLEIFFDNKIKALEQNEFQDKTIETLSKSQDDQDLETIVRIEAVIGKETLTKLSGWHQYVSGALSNNPLSGHATKVILAIGNLLNNLEEWLDFGITYESIDVDNQVAIILTQLEHMVDFVASGTTYVGFPPRYPDFDPDDDYGYGGGSSSGDGSGNDSNGQEFILFAGQNVTTHSDI